MKKFFGEFKEFAMRGNVVDMAVGVIVGAAFKAIVDSLVNDIISPLLGTFLKTDFSELTLTLSPATEAVLDAQGNVVTEATDAVLFKYGAFITAIINFIIMAFVIFMLVKGLNKLANLGKKKVEEAPAEPTTKKCPFCCSEIAIEAVKCPHCASDQPKEE